MLREDATVSVDEIKANNEYAEKLIDISNTIIVYDMIKKQNETKELISEYNNSQE